MFDETSFVWEGILPKQIKGDRAARAAAQEAYDRAWSAWRADRDGRNIAAWYAESERLTAKRGLTHLPRS